jgi:hypothetical protein
MKQKRPVKALHIRPDGTIHDPNTGNIFQTAKDAAEWWIKQSQLLAVIDFPKEEQKIGDTVLGKDNLWTAKGFPQTFRSENTAKAFGKWMLAGGDRAVISGKSFSASLDDVVRLILQADPTKDQNRSTAAECLGRALSMILSSVPWVNPRLDVTLSVSSEFVQASILIGTLDCAGVTLRAWTDGGLEIVSDDQEWPKIGIVVGDTDEIGMISIAVQHLKALEKELPTYTFQKNLPEALQFQMVAETLVVNDYTVAVVPDKSQFPVVPTAVDEIVFTTNPRRTSLFIRSLDERWHYIPAASQVSPLWNTLETAGSLVKIIR